MRLGIITGSGNYEWPGLVESQNELVDTAYGAVELTRGTFAGVDLVHIARHGQGHVRLSNNVDHRANIAALRACGVDALVSCTVCGAVTRNVPLESIVVFDDIYFPSNRLPDGTLCTWYDAAGFAGRGHWIFDRPFSEPLRNSLVRAGEGIGVPVVPAGCYGHVDGPRFNSRSEITALAHCGVVAVSQTAGPEVVLAGEAELPMALIGFVTDHANGVADEPELADNLTTRIAKSAGVFSSLLETAIPLMSEPPPTGVVFRFA